jgi:ElaB/YqjD/DUF883 family membrane-anchored ribosome-binding protein
VAASVRFLLSWTALLACMACSPAAERPPSTSSLEPAPSGFAFSAEDAERLEARIDRDPREAVLYLEKVVASSIASLSDEQFERLRSQLIELLDEGRLQRLVRAGREAPATSHEVARLLDDLEAWDDSIQRGIDVPDPGYYDR